MQRLKHLRSQAAFRIWLFFALAVAWGVPMMQAEPSLRIVDAYFYVFAIWLGAILVNAVLAYAGSRSDDGVSKHDGES